MNPNTSSSRVLPDFEDPPVVEVVLGVQFPPLKHLELQHFGLYWARIRANYPGFSSRNPLPTVFEKFEPDDEANFSVDVKISRIPEIRGWYINSEKNRLFQVQKDRFIYNWRKVKKEEPYPHYENIEPKFKEEWQEYCQFLKEEDIGNPEVNQCEVTYINHLEINRGWGSYGEFQKIFKCWAAQPEFNYLPSPEKIVLYSTFLMVEDNGEKGRLHISVEPALNQDGKEMLRLELTARGKPSKNELGGILNWFNAGHKWIVRGFTDFTTVDMHKLWGVK